MLITESIYEIKDLPFIQDVTAKGGKIFSVGGAIRDAFLNKQSKDLDILISNIHVEDLMDILNKYGKVDLVGMSFGVIKFQPTGATPGEEPIDIAIPRTEKKVGGGHKGFVVNADPFLPIEKDLERRDFTMNAIAKDLEGNIIDPFHGIQDIKNKIIRVVNPVAFAEDPLRMVRAVQFAARFNFTIEPKTMALIKDNAHLVTYGSFGDTLIGVSGERILGEFLKITDKGNPTVGVELLVSTGLFKAIFGFDFRGDFNSFQHIKTLGKFVFELMRGNNVSAQEIYLKNLKGDVDTGREILAYEKLEKGVKSEPLQQKLSLFDALNTSPRILEFGQVPNEMQKFLQDFKSGKYPKSRKEVAVKGEDLMGIGLKGIEVGECLNNILSQILNDTLKNDHKSIMGSLVKQRMGKLG